MYKKKILVSRKKKGILEKIIIVQLLWLNSSNPWPKPWTQSSLIFYSLKFIINLKNDGKKNQDSRAYAQHNWATEMKSLKTLVGLHSLGFFLFF